jgi:hypothetical protein
MDRSSLRTTASGMGSKVDPDGIVPVAVTLPGPPSRIAAAAPPATSRTAARVIAAARALTLVGRGRWRGPGGVPPDSESVTGDSGPSEPTGMITAA